jgi:predicted cupin superfamily sugar epimerase
MTAEELIKQLGLTRHPEGGWYRETYRSSETVSADRLPDRFNGERSFSTAICFLLGRDEMSALHRIKSDEIWYYHAGTTLTVHLISPQAEYRVLKIGPDPAVGESYQAVVPAGYWFGATVTGAGDFSLVGCSVSPGFDFADFEMGSRSELLKQFPVQAGIILQLTKADPEEI